MLLMNELEKLKAARFFRLLHGEIKIYVQVQQNAVHPSMHTQPPFSLSIDSLREYKTQLHFTSRSTRFFFPYFTKRWY